MKRWSIAAFLVISATACDEASTPSGEPGKQVAAPEAGAEVSPAKAPSADAPPSPATPSSATDPSSAPPSSATKPAATPPPDEVAPAPTPPSPSGPRWSLSCKAKGKPWTLTAELRPGDRVLALGLADDAGHSRTWSKPEMLVLVADLEEHVLAIQSPRSGRSNAEFVEFFALPKTFGLRDAEATFRAEGTFEPLDDPEGIAELVLTCKAHREEGP